MTITKPNLAIQMIASFFGGKLDAFFGFAQRQQHGFRGATPSRASRRADQQAVAKMKLKPFHLRPGYLGQKPLSTTDMERVAAKARKARGGKPFFHADDYLRIPPKVITNQEVSFA